MAKLRLQLRPKRIIAGTGCGKIALALDCSKRPSRKSNSKSTEIPSDLPIIDYLGPSGNEVLSMRGKTALLAATKDSDGIIGVFLKVAGNIDRRA